MKQYLTKKLTKRGFKVWVRALVTLVNLKSTLERILVRVMLREVWKSK